MIVGLLRIKNEARWIERVLKALDGVCERILILDDHSTDETPEIAEKYATVFRSTFEGLDETRDRQFLLDRAYEFAKVGDWIFCIDGDEELHQSDKKTVVQCTKGMLGNYCVFTQQIVYLWDEPDQVRMDGIYANFTRPSLFKLTRKDLTYRTTQFTGNLHCPTLPQELTFTSHRPTKVRLLHWGYYDAPLRKQKYDRYNLLDPESAIEDGYRHITQGDASGVPADAKLLHAGPLRLVRI